MKTRKVKYTDGPIGNIKMVADFLPPPDQLILKEETVKVTLSLTKESVDFFKRVAKYTHSHYQTMIRILLDQYTVHHR